VYLSENLGRLLIHYDEKIEYPANAAITLDDGTWMGLIVTKGTSMPGILLVHMLRTEGFSSDQVTAFLSGNDHYDTFAASWTQYGQELATNDHAPRLVNSLEKRIATAVDEGEFVFRLDDPTTHVPSSVNVGNRACLYPVLTDGIRIELGTVTRIEVY